MNIVHRMAHGCVQNVATVEKWDVTHPSHLIAKVTAGHVSKSYSVFSVRNETEGLCHVVVVAMVTFSIDKRLRVWCSGLCTHSTCNTGDYFHNKLIFFLFVCFFLAMILTKLAASTLNPKEISKYLRPARHGLGTWKVAKLPMAVCVQFGLFELV